MKKTPKDFLEHFGIMGMKWGKRKSKSSKPKTPTIRKTSDDNEVKKMIKEKKVTELSNAEIKKINERLQLERQFKDLTKKTVSPGRKFVEELLANAAREVAANYVRKQITKLVEKGVK